MIFDGCGQNAKEPYAVLIPDGQSLKMLAGFSPQEKTEPSIAAYVAGLVDGDGSIYIQKGRTTQLYPAIGIRLGWKGRGTLEELQKQFGGHYSSENRPYHKDHSEVFRWMLVSKRASMVLKMIYPYLRVKRVQAALALHVWSIWQEKGENRYSECLALKRLMGLLNKTGPEYALPVVGSWLMIPRLSEEKPTLRWSETWPRSGKLVNGRIYEQATWVRRKDGKGSGLWRTPQSWNAQQGPKSKELYEKCAKLEGESRELRSELQVLDRWEAYKSAHYELENVRNAYKQVGKHIKAYDEAKSAWNQA